MGLFDRKRTKVLEAVANRGVGESVVVDGSSGTIIGTCVFDEAGDRWVEHLVAFTDGRRAWLSVENFDRTTATLWASVSSFAVNGGPDDRTVHLGGTEYRRNESGTARFHATGDTGVADTGAIDYRDFLADSGERFSFERYGAPGAGRRSLAASGSCASCGAALAVDALGRCTHCGTATVVDEGGWDGWEAAHGRDVTQTVG